MIAETIKTSFDWLELKATGARLERTECRAEVTEAESVQEMWQKGQHVALAENIRN